MFSRFDTILVCDRQMDRQHSLRYAYALYGHKFNKFPQFLVIFYYFLSLKSATVKFNDFKELPERPATLA